MYEHMDVTKNLPDGAEVELKVYNKEKYDDQNYESGVYLSCDFLNADDITALYALNEKLEKLGFKIEITHYARENFESNVIMIRENREISMKKIKRNAGRKKDYGMEKRYTPCTVAELLEMQKTMNNKAIIKKLDVPQATFYRILKNIKKLEEWGGLEDVLNHSIYSYSS